jgi:hypothetical protein
VRTVESTTRGLGLGFGFGLGLGFGFGLGLGAGVRFGTVDATGGETLAPGRVPVAEVAATALVAEPP